MTGWNVRIGLAARIIIVFSLLLTPALSQGDVIPPTVPDARATDSAKEPEPLEKGKPVEKGLAVGEVHAYALKVDADQTVTVLLEKRGVAAVVTLFAPDGMKVGIFGSAASSQGTEQIAFVAENAGTYRIAVRTFFKPSPPGQYLITLAEVHATSDQEKSGLAKRSCEEKSWLDSENNFLVKEALVSISQCVAAVGHKLITQFPQAAEVAAEANAEASYLTGRWRWGEFVSAAYQENLVGDFRMLASAAEEPDAKRAFAIMQGVVEDLKIKADHCRKSNRGLGKDIDVYMKTYVDTKEGPVEVPKLTVYYKLGIYRYSKESSRSTEFNSLSSPAYAKLPPGNYFLWTGKHGAAEPLLNKQKELPVGSGADKIEKYLFYEQ